MTEQKTLLIHDVFSVAADSDDARVHDLSKSYDGNPALQDVSFEAAAGTTVAICGENGAGKSTLMKILSGAIRPDSGEIRLDGKTRRDRRAARCDRARHPAPSIRSSASCRI